MHGVLKKKKGQATAARASILVLVITVAIIFYVLFLPPEERSKLLDGDSGSSSSSSSDKTLLLETPGRLDYLKEKSFEYALPSFNLYSTTNAALLKDEDSVYVKKTIFSEKSQNVSFTIDDLKNTKNIQLSFQRSTAKGRLMVTLNGRQIVQRYIDTAYPAPIDLQKEYMIEGQNQLEFKVSSPGILFFMINEYELKDVKITAQVTDTTTLQNKQIFFVKENEKNNLDYASLRFMTNCKTTETGLLKVYVNYQTIYEGVPDCVKPQTINIDKNNILNGENRLKFLAESGTYIIDQIRVKTYLKEAIYPTYYFELSSDLYEEAITNDEKDVNLTIIFVPDTELGNDLELEINGHKRSVQTDERTFSLLIDAYLREGNNALTIRPMHSSLEIVEIEVLTQDKEE